ncbi:MAG: peptide chain release factor N(5)-glutamine methyltransferase [Kiritimatiellia bacterium]
MDTEQKTVAEVASLGQSFLEARAIPDARLKCEMLLSRLLSVPRLALGLHSRTVLRPAQLEAMRRGLKRLREGEPVQHVIGETGFMQHIFKSDRRALIPRPETEMLVQRVLADEALWARECPSIVDVGTGSGCIVLSLAAEHRDARYLALDISADALSLARENAQRLHLDDAVIFFEGCLGDVAEPEMLDAIVANLPYIPAADIEHLEKCVRDFEPRLALDGGASGLDIIEDLIADAAIVLKCEGRIFLEIGDKQGFAVRRMLEEGGFEHVEVLPDLNGRERVVCGVLAG